MESKIATSLDEDVFKLEPPAFLRQIMAPAKCECVPKLLLHISKLLATKDEIRE